MATIIPVKTKSKGTRYQAIIRRKGQKPIKKTFDTKGQAKFWSSEQENLIYQKRYKDPRLAEKVDLYTALEKYSTYEPVTREKKPSTLDREKYSRANIERVIGGETPLAEITHAVVAAYQETRLKEGASASSIRQELAMLSKMFRKARSDWGLPVGNPTEEVERVKPSQGRERFLTDQEAAAVLAEAANSRNDRYLPFLLLLMHTGMRSGEAARVNSSNVDIERRVVTITETKSKKPRSVPLTTRAAEALAAIDPLQDGFYFLKPNHRQSKHIMLRPGCIFRECWLRMWERLEKKSKNCENFTKIPYFKVHDIRHTAASHLLKAGVDVRVIADILGHSTLQMVMRYTHVFDETRTATIDNLNHLGFSHDND